MTDIYTVGNRIFIDTGAWIALAVVRDRHHEKSRAIFEAILAKGVEQVTSNLIVSETYTFLRYNVGYKAAIRFLESVREAENLEFLHVAYSTPFLEEKAWDILKKYHDQDLSYVDAVSFAILEQRSDITDVFAFDGHFCLTSKHVIQG